MCKVMVCQTHQCGEKLEIPETIEGGWIPSVYCHECCEYASDADVIIALGYDYMVAESIRWASDGEIFDQIDQSRGEMTWQEIEKWEEIGNEIIVSELMEMYGGLQVHFDDDGPSIGLNLDNTYDEDADKSMWHSKYEELYCNAANDAYNQIMEMRTQREIENSSLELLDHDQGCWG